MITSNDSALGHDYSLSRNVHVHESIKIGNKVYKITDKKLFDEARKTFAENSELKKVSLNCKVVLKKDIPMSIHILDNNGICIDLSSDICPVPALNAPITKERIISQISKTNNTPFSFENIDVDMDDNIYVSPISSLNELRRNVLCLMENEIIIRNGFDMSRIDAVKNPIIKTDKKKNSATKKEYVISVTTKQQLEMIKNRNYSYKRVYLDYQLVLELEKDELDELGSSWEIGVIYPRIVRKNAKKVLDEIFDKSSNFLYAVVKNLETLAYLKKQNYEGKLIADYTLYICNSKSANWAQSVVDGLCYPVELNRNELTQIDVSDSIIKEQLVYAYLPLMVTANCIKKTTDRCGQSNATEIIYDR